jgi:hypothetical protein
VRWLERPYGRWWGGHSSLLPSFRESVPFILPKTKIPKSFYKDGDRQNVRIDARFPGPGLEEIDKVVRDFVIKLPCHFREEPVCDPGGDEGDKGHSDRRR